MGPIFKTSLGDELARVAQRRIDRHVEYWRKRAIRLAYEVKRLREQLDERNGERGPRQP